MRTGISANTDLYRYVYFIFRFLSAQLPFIPACGEAGGRSRIESIILNYSEFVLAADSRRRHAFALALSLLFAPAVRAELSSVNEKSLKPMVVIGSRFASDPDNSPVGATVITADQIRAAGVTNVNEAIIKIGGVLGRQNLAGSPDAALDLRGFGATSEQNLVIMVDGVRLSEIDLGVAMLSSIPLDSVERIEIVRGGSSVMYGSGATGGTIQVITKRAARSQQSGSVFAGAGSYGNRELRVGLNQGWDNFAFDINASTQAADNYRRNSGFEQNLVSAALQRFNDHGRIGLRIDAANQATGLPGSLTLDEFKADPRRSNKLQDSGKIDMNRITLFAEQRIGTLDFAVDFSNRSQHSFANYVADGWLSEYDSRSKQLSPRIKHVSEIGGLRNELVVGVDLLRSERQYVGSAADKQDSDAIYLRNEIRSGRATYAAGMRHENFRQLSGTNVKKSGLNAWELQGAFDLQKGINVYGKLGDSYRVALVDENTGATSTLAPQTSHDLEVGANFSNAASKLTLAWFRHQLTNEIIFNPEAPTADIRFTGANVNLDPTTRQGIELRLRHALTSTLAVNATLQHVDVRFREGPLVGREVPLVSPNSAAVRFNWQPGTGHSANIGWQWADSQRYGNDFANSCSSRIPAFSTLDARYALRRGKWEFAVIGNNLTDHHYFSTAYGSCRNGIYPDPGRILRLTARRDF